MCTLALVVALVSLWASVMTFYSVWVYPKEPASRQWYDFAGRPMRPQ